MPHVRYARFSVHFSNVEELPRKSRETHVQPSKCITHGHEDGRDGAVIIKVHFRIPLILFLVGAGTEQLKEVYTHLQSSAASHQLQVHVHKSVLVVVGTVSSDKKSLAVEAPVQTQRLHQRDEVYVQPQRPHK